MNETQENVTLQTLREIERGEREKREKGRGDGRER